MALERSAKTREQNRLSMGIAGLVVGVLIVVILVTSLGLYRRLRANKEKIAELNEAIAKEEQRTEEIEQYKQYTQSKEYIEEVAREKLGLVYEGEVIFKQGTSE